MSKLRENLTTPITSTLPHSADPAYANALDTGGTVADAVPPPQGIKVVDGRVIPYGVEGLPLAEQDALARQQRNDFVNDLLKKRSK